MHLDHEKVQRFLHQELPGGELLEAQEHLEACDRCAASVEQARAEEEEISALLVHLDRPMPRPDLERVLGAASKPRPRFHRWAAGLLLALGVTSAAYAAPGSPLPGLLHRIAEWVGSPASAPAPPVPEETVEPSASGITVLPGESLTVRFAAHQTRGDVVISLTEGREVVVRAEAGHLGFTSGLEDLLVLNEGMESDVEILVPRSAPMVQILVEGEVVFSLARGTVTTPVGPDEDGRYLIPLQEHGG